MKPTPIHEVLRRIKALSPFHQACHLRGLIASEPRRGIRRHELEEALKALMNRQLKRENRAA
jgi:hypothetical protein